MNVGQKYRAEESENHAKNVKMVLFLSVMGCIGIFRHDLNNSYGEDMLVVYILILSTHTLTNFREQVSRYG